MSSAEKNPDLLTLVLEGHKVMPVRAIPFFTAFEISPNELASQLGRIHGAPFQRFQSLQAFHLVAGKQVPVTEGEWRHVFVDLEAQVDEIALSTTEITPGQDRIGRARWRRESVALLPPGVFVHLDELLRHLANDFENNPDQWESRRQLTSLEQILSYEPVAARGLDDLLFEGFPRSLRGEPVEGGSDLDSDVAQTRSDAMPRKWTPERIEDARKMYERLKAEGRRDYTYATAQAFGVSTQRLRTVLREQTPSRDHAPWISLKADRASR